MKPPPPPPSSSDVPVGWYDDPTDGTRRRYWDGDEWTNQIAPKEPPGRTFRGEGSPPQPVVVKKHGCLSAIGGVVVIVVVLIAALLVWGAATTDTDTGSGDDERRSATRVADDPVSKRSAIARCLTSDDGYITHPTLDAALQMRTPPRYVRTVTVRPLDDGNVTGDTVDLRLTYRAVDHAGIERTYHVDAEMTVDCEIEDVIEDTGESKPAPPVTTTIPPVNYYGAYFVSVPDTPPTGRCTIHIDSRDEYAWENCQLWGRTEQTKENVQFVTVDEANDIVEFIWERVHVDGKPTTPPGVELANLCEEFCRPWYAPAEHLIYLPYVHYTATDTDVAPFLPMLHEVAHALLPADQGHNESDLFRCVLEYLYDAYGGFAATGVCGHSDAEIELPATTAEGDNQ